MHSEENHIKSAVIQFKPSPCRPVCRVLSHTLPLHSALCLLCCATLVHPTLLYGATGLPCSLLSPDSTLDFSSMLCSTLSNTSTLHWSPLLYIASTLAAAGAAPLAENAPRRSSQDIGTPSFDDDDDDDNDDASHRNDKKR